MSGMRFVFTLCALLAPMSAQTQDAARLPIKRIVLYKNGVGYFEHVGTVRDRQDVSIPFTSGQLNDVLKSLTVLDLNGGRITGVGYGSSAPAERQLGDLRLPLEDATSLNAFLASLRGARLEVHSGTTVATGRLLSIERKTRAVGNNTVEVDEITLISDNGELRTAEVSPGMSVRLLDPGLAGKVGRGLDILAAGREADVRRMTISTEGTGERSLFVSYISEVPVWKSTYRIVLNAKEHRQPLLQGWAIIDNTVGQDWENVQLSLVAGAPQSFVQNLSQPYYTRRPVVPMPNDVLSAPQTHEATLMPGGARLYGRVTDPSGAAISGASVMVYDSSGALAGQMISDSGGNYQFAKVPDGAMRLVVESPGFGAASMPGITLGSAGSRQQNFQLNVGNASQSVTVTGQSPMMQTSNAEMSAAPVNGRTVGSGRMLGSGGGIGVGRGGGVGSGSSGGVLGGIVGGIYDQTAAAQGRDLGDLFEYKLKDPITVLKNRSALVPIAQSNIAAEKVSLWNERLGMNRAERALWLTNSTGLTLDGGSFSVMEEETFAGEGIFDPIRPGEKRLVSYATDLALTVSAKTGNEAQQVTHVRVAHGLLTQMREIRETRTYTMRNQDTTARSVIVEHPVRNAYQLRGDAHPEETTADWMRFRVAIEPKQTATLVVEEARPLQTSFQITNITPQQVEVFVREKTIDRAVEDALRKILAQKEVVAGLSAKKDAAEEETKTIYDDQQRLRENMKSLKGSAEEKALLQRYTGQLNQQENRLEELHKQQAEFEKQEEAEQEKLDRMIEELAIG